MNRNNSVEPSISQPLQGAVTYHQLLQSKTKIEDELYQTQRQLRRKEGEYLKKIAVYEQKIDQMQEQIDEFSQREETTKTMYEKILNALNNDDKAQSYGLDIERMQEYLQDFCNSRSNSPRGNNGTNSVTSSCQRKSRQTNYQNNTNPSFERGQNGHIEKANQSESQAKIEELQMNLQQLNDKYQALLQNMTLKEKENLDLSHQVEILTAQLENFNAQQTEKLDMLKVSLMEQFEAKKEQIQHQNSIAMNNLALEYQNHIQSLEKQINNLQDLAASHVQDSPIKVKLKKQQEKQVSQLKDQLKLLERENQEFKVINDRLKKEQEIDSDERNKEREQFRDFVTQQEHVIQKLKKQMNTNVTNHNEATKRLRAKLQESEKELQAKNEEITKLKNKLQNQKQPGVKAENIFTEKRNSGGAIVMGINNYGKSQAVNVGNKDLQVIVDIQTNDKNRRLASGLGSSMPKSGCLKSSKANLGSTKMFGQTIQSIQQQQMQNGSYYPHNQDVSYVQHNTSSLNTSNNMINQHASVSRNSNNCSQTSMPISTQIDSSRSCTPNHKVQQTHSHQSTAQFQNDQSRSTSNSTFQAQDHGHSQQTNNNTALSKQNNQLLKYINIQGKQSEANLHSMQNNNSNNNNNLGCGANDNLTTMDNSEQTFTYNLARKGSQERNQVIFQSDCQKMLYSSIEIENVVRKMLDQVQLEKQLDQSQSSSVLMPSQYHNMQTPSQNVSFSMRKQSCQEDIHRLQQKNGGGGTCNKNVFTIDREFLSKLEISLKKLTKSNEKIKQIMKEKENLEKICEKLKLKVKRLKEEKNIIAIDREGLINQMHKLECKLKQAQVILNLEGEQMSSSNNINPINTTLFNLSHNSSSKTLAKQFNNSSNNNIQTRDVSPGCNLTLNIIQDQQNNERYKHPPMSCRVNDSYDISLRLGNSSAKKPILQNNLDKSSIDQSLLTIRRDFQHQQLQSQNLMTHNSSSNTRIPTQQSQVTTKFYPKNVYNQYAGSSNLNTSKGYGKTPCLQINLSSGPMDNYFIGNQPQHQMINAPPISVNNRLSQASSDPDDSCQVLTSRNFSKSTTNLLNKRSFNKSQVPAERTSSGTARQLFRYQSNREATQLFRSPSHNNGTFGKLPKEPTAIIPSTTVSPTKINQIDNQMQKTQKFHQPLYLNGPQGVSKNSSNGGLLRRMNSTKAKDRYYTKNCSEKEKCRIRDFSTHNKAKVNQQEAHQMLAFDEEDSSKIQERTFEQEPQQQQNFNHYDCSDDQLVDDLEEDHSSQNRGGQSASKHQYHHYNSDDQELNRESTLNLNKLMKCASNRSNGMFSETTKFRKILRKRDEGSIPSDEREDDEESIQYKLLNNSNFNPSMHSRYVNDELLSQ